MQVDGIEVASAGAAQEGEAEGPPHSKGAWRPDESSASARINQYEKGKHTPDYQTLERLAQVLGVPVPFFYTRDNALADLILAWGTLSTTDRKRLLKQATGGA